MKKLTILLATAFAINANAQVKLNNEKDSASYAMGVHWATKASFEMGNEINMQAFSQGIFDCINQTDKQQISTENVPSIVEAYFKKLEAAEQEKMQEMCLANEEFLQKNKENKDVITLENGLQYKVVTPSKSNQYPTDSDNVKVHYKGSLIDGTTFDSSIDRGEPATFPVGNLIPGFTQILKLMNVGSTYIAYIPSDLGYGMRDMGTIKPCSTLIFEISLLEIISPNNNEISQENISTEEHPQKSKKEKKAKK